MEGPIRTLEAGFQPSEVGQHPVWASCLWFSLLQPCPDPGGRITGGQAGAKYPLDQKPK